MWRAVRRTTAAAIVGAALVPAAMVHAQTPRQPEWADEQTAVLADGEDYTVEDLALAVGGGATLGLSRDEAAGVVPLALERPAAGQPWGPATPLAAAGRVDIGPFVARSDTGDTLAVWATLGGPVTAAVRRGAAWQKPLETGAAMPIARTSDALKVAIGPNRVARVAVLSCGSSCTVVVYTRAPKTKGWAASDQLKIPAAATATVGWSMGTNGDILVTWRIGTRILAARRPPSATKWQKAPDKLTVGDATGSIATTVDPRGNMAVAWPTAQGVGTSVRRADATRWGAPRRVTRTAGAGQPTVGLGCEGSVVAAWPQIEGAVTSVFATVGTGADGLLTEPGKIGTYGREDRLLSITRTTLLGASGLGFVSWVREDGDAIGAGSVRGDDGTTRIGGLGFGGAFRESPAPRFTADGRGLVATTSRDGLIFQEFIPGEDRVRCP